VPLDVRQLSPALGAEITGADLARPLSDDDFAVIKRVHLDHCVLVFPDQHLTPDQHIAFSRRFGDLHIHMLTQYLMDGHPELLVLSNVKRDGRAIGIEDAGRYWHSDITYEEVPPLGSLLYGVEVPPEGGDTLFANMYAVYEALSPALRNALARLDGVYTTNLVHGSSGQFAAASGADRNRRQPDDLPVDVVHPIVRTHPETQRKAIYATLAHTREFVGFTRDESLPMLEYLAELARLPECGARLVWQPGTVAIWDNRCVQHCAHGGYDGHRRVMHRVTLAGDKPY